MLADDNLRGRANHDEQRRMHLPPGLVTVCAVLIELLLTPSVKSASCRRPPFTFTTLKLAKMLGSVRIWNPHPDLSLFPARVGSGLVRTGPGEPGPQAAARLYLV